MRVFLIVLDSFGIGLAPDGKKFGDHKANTLESISKSSFFKADNLIAAGLGNITGVKGIKKVKKPHGAYGRLREISAGKDTTTGHWEIAGLVSASPMPVYPDGFPAEIIKEIESQTGRKVLCNKPYSGTDVIKDYGAEHKKTGSIIVYTSADSVLQIAADEAIIPPEELYSICRTVRKIMVDRHGVGRIIARPYTEENGIYTRTSNRRDFSLEPPSDTLIDILKKASKDTIAIGKIGDIFAERGFSEIIHTKDNRDGMNITFSMLDKTFDGLCFVNLVEFDSAYGHRNDVDGYAKAIADFDAWLPTFTEKMQETDILMITADHGCDPGTVGTDHTREYTPVICIGKDIRPVNLGTKKCFGNIAVTIADIFGIENNLFGKSFYGKIKKKEKN